MPTTPVDYVDYTFDDIFDEEYDKEFQGKYRYLQHKDTKVHIRCEDPYGFWYVTVEKGSIPDFLKGSYTSFDLALKDVNRWLRNKKEPYIPSAVQKKLDEKKAGASN